MFNIRDLCQVCRHYDIGVNQCSKVSKRAIPKSKCADFENKGAKDEMGENQCAQCANQCKADGGMDYCDKFIDEEEAERIANTKRIEELRKRCEEFMQGLVYDFGDIIVADTADISETERNEVKWNIQKKTTYVYKTPFIDFRLCFTAYKKD